MRNSLLEHEVIKDSSGTEHQAIKATGLLAGGFSAG